jgi:hypothetical protein
VVVFGFKVSFLLFGVELFLLFILMLYLLVFCRNLVCMSPCLSMMTSGVVVSNTLHVYILKYINQIVSNLIINVCILYLIVSNLIIKVYAPRRGTGRGVALPCRGGGGSRSLTIFCSKGGVRGEA